MAGNIIPAIATTNAVIAGLIVMEGLKVLMGNINDCRTVSDKNNLNHNNISFILVIYLQIIRKIHEDLKTLSL